MLQSESPHQRASVLTGHSFNWDRSMVAYCPNSEEVEIFGNCHDGDSSKWEKAYTLSEAGGGVSGLIYEDGWRASVGGGMGCVVCVCERERRGIVCLRGAAVWR